MRPVILLPGAGTSLIVVAKALTAADIKRRKSEAFSMAPAAIRGVIAAVAAALDDLEDEVGIEGLDLPVSSSPSADYISNAIRGNCIPAFLYRVLDQSE